MYMGLFSKLFKKKNTVAPQWAWINEINVFGNMDKMGKNTDTDYQFVEVAVPADANISGWNIRFLEALSDKQILTNVVATFGSDNISSTKKDLIGMASNMVYRVVSNKASLESGRLKLDDGTTDGAWSIRNKGVAQMVTGELDWREPFAVQLVRGSGIVEHEVVRVGTNSFPETSMWYGEFHPTNLVARLERNMPGADFIYIGDDDRGSPNSLSVLSSRGETSNHWSNAVSCTPGRVNNGQVILGQPPTPNGSSIRIFATLDSSFGHITPSIGDVVNTNANLIIVIDKGNPTGTNITYTVDPWYELAGVTTNGAPARYEGVAKRVYKVNVAAGASNDVTVVAGAKIADSLVNEFGLGPDNNYRDAVMDWLEKGVDANNKKWANPESGEIKLAQYCSLSGNVVTNLTLTQMYWLDMDPTVGDLALVGGMVKAPQTILRSAGIGSSELDAGYESNLKMAVKMYITNRTDDVDSKYYNKPAWSPYILRGRGKGETSWTYAQSSSQSWSNVTFKITGFLATAQVGHVPSNKESWVPLRWFVFNKDSFDANHISHIEIKDPFGTDTPGYSAGWYDWKKNNGETPVFFGWALDTRLRPFPVEVLKETNYYE